MGIARGGALGSADAWSVVDEAVGSPEATLLRRRDYYADVASRYWRRPATSEEVDAWLAGDCAASLAPPTGAFVVGRHRGAPAACGGVLLLDGGRAELTRVCVRPAFRRCGRLLLDALEARARALGAHRMVLNTRLDLVEARALYARRGHTGIPAYSTGPYQEVRYGKSL